MIGTVIALIFALILHFSTIGQETIPNQPILGLILIAVATVFLIIPTLAIALSWSPMQHAEQQLTPRVSELFLKDRHIKLIGIILTLFPLLTYIMAIDVLFLNNFSKNLLIPAWIVMLGIALDAVWYLLRRVFQNFDPFSVVSMFTKEAEKSIQEDKDEELCSWIEALSEVGMRGLQRSSTSLCIQIDDDLQHIIKLFLKSAKSISHASLDEKIKDGNIDKVSYTLFFFLQRLEMIQNKAIERRVEPVCSHLVTVLGKTVIDAAKYDITMAVYPLHFMGKFAAAAQQNGMAEIGQKAILTLLEVSRTILDEIDVKYVQLEAPFTSIINQMNTITKEMFRKDKTISVKLLTQPFRDLRTFFTSDKMASHQDSPAILQKIDAVLGEYDALDAVLRTMPPIPKVPPQSTESTTIPPAPMEFKEE